MPHHGIESGVPRARRSHPPAHPAPAPGTTTLVRRYRRRLRQQLANHLAASGGAAGRGADRSGTQRQIHRIRREHHRAPGGHRTAPGRRPRSEIPMAIERRALIGLIVAFTASIVAFPMLPPDIPPQVGHDGVFIGAPFVAFLLPVAAMAVWWIVANLSRHPPRATLRPTNAGAATALFLSAFHVTMLMAFIGGQPWLVR